MGRALACLAAVLVWGVAVSACGSSSSPAGSKDGGHGPDGSVHADATHTDVRKPPAKDSGVDAGVADADAGVDAYAVPDAWNQSYPRPSDEAGAASRESCAFKRGDMPAQTTGPSTPLGSDNPIEHIVVLMQENRSFDSYFGHLQAYEATKGIQNTIESAPATAYNPNFPQDQLDAGPGKADAGNHPWTHAPQLCFLDTAHSWGAAHLEYDKGLNDGFFYTNQENVDGVDTTGLAPAQLTGARAMWWYDQTDLPFYYDLYSTFAMADHYHSALLGSTYPNRMYLYSGTSFGLTGNTFPNISAFPTPETPVIIFDELLVRGIPFKWYTDMGAPAEEVVLLSGGGAIPRYGFDPAAPFTQFLTDAQAGNLPPVSFIDGDNLNETTTGNDEHPPDDIEEAQQFVWQIVNAVLTSPNWSTTALFLTYDENGGIYDHVAPPAACEPDNLQPVLATPLDQSQPGAFNQYGFRVPFVVISPYAKRSYVSHTVYSHTSIIRFIESKFTLPALTARDANADPFTDLFDWQNPPFMTPPTFAQPSVNEAGVTTCTNELTP